MTSIEPDLEAKIGYSFSDRQRLERALTHSSLVNENNMPSENSNERLEYLGDAVLGLIIAHELYSLMPRAPEGRLTRLRAGLVCRATLAYLAGKLELGRYLRMGKGEEASGGRSKPANLARGMEALFGAMFLDGGLDESRRVILNLYGDELEELALNQACADSKSELQQLTQARKLGKPSYRIIETSGPAHNPAFTAQVSIEDRILATGKGRSKKTAEANAAFNAIKALG